MTTIPDIPLPSAPGEMPKELLEYSTFLLKRLGFAAKERAMREFERLGLSPYHHAVLAVLSESARDTQAAIADALGYDRGQLVGLLDELEERRLIERRRDPVDRRRHLVSLTADGRRTLGRLRSVARQLEDEFLAPLEPEERAELHDLLLRLARHHEPRCGLAPASEAAPGIVVQSA
ncbi:MAG: MarR family winged helix-turn-helix transcriptional regulator [Gaiellaceae bacterium]